MQIFRFLSQNQDKIVLIIGAILVALVGFAAGRLTALQNQTEPLVIEEPEQNLQFAQEEEGSVLGKTADKEKSTQETIQTDKEELGTQATEGKYVGSKNSKKYHYPDCRYAKKISQENKIWFKSIKEAQEAGYEPCKVCKPPTSDQ